MISVALAALCRTRSARSAPAPPAGTKDCLVSFGPALPRNLAETKLWLMESCFSQVCMRTMAEAGPTGYRQRALPTTGGAHRPLLGNLGIKCFDLIGNWLVIGSSGILKLPKIDSWERKLGIKNPGCQNCRLNHNLILIWSVCHPYRRRARACSATECVGVNTEQSGIDSMSACTPTSESHCHGHGLRHHHGAGCAPQVCPSSCSPSPLRTRH
jgi:hypothetical protein